MIDHLAVQQHEFLTAVLTHDKWPFNHDQLMGTIFATDGCKIEVIFYLFSHFTVPLIPRFIDGSVSDVPTKCHRSRCTTDVDRSICFRQNTCQRIFSPGVVEKVSFAFKLNPIKVLMNSTNDHSFHYFRFINPRQS